MVSTSNSRCGGPDCFLGGEVTNLLFEGFNERIIGREAEIRCSMVNCGERLLEGRGRGEGVCEIPVRLTMSADVMETVEYK